MVSAAKTVEDCFVVCRVCYCSGSRICRITALDSEIAMDFESSFILAFTSVYKSERSLCTGSDTDLVTVSGFLHCSRKGSGCLPSEAFCKSVSVSLDIVSE